MTNYNTLVPYETIEYSGISYGHCREFDHICRYKGLRQVTHNLDADDKFTALETPNSFTTSCDVVYYEVPASEENRLDVVAYKFLGSSQYGWVIAYINKIDDGFTIYEGQKLAIPRNISSLFNKGECLASVSALTLNLGTE